MTTTKNIAKLESKEMGFFRYEGKQKVVALGEKETISVYSSGGLKIVSWEATLYFRLSDDETLTPITKEQFMDWYESAHLWTTDRIKVIGDLTISK